MSSSAGTTHPESSPSKPLETATQASSACSESHNYNKTIMVDRTTTLPAEPSACIEQQQQQHEPQLEPLFDLHAITDTILTARLRRNDPPLIRTVLQEKFPNAPCLFCRLGKSRDTNDTAQQRHQQEDDTDNGWDNGIWIPWQAPGHGSDLPTLSCLLECCYSLYAWLNNNKNSVHSPIAIVQCSNGLSRTGLVVACYLKFIHLVDTSLDGFCHFLERRVDNNPKIQDLETIVTRQLPPSIPTLFRNFDQLLELETVLNRKPLLLRAVAMQGVPVDTVPCLDIWDGTGRHVYNSRSEWPSDLSSSSSSNHANEQQPPPRTQQWADDEGFFKVNCVLEGDFSIVCQFGGPHAEPSSHWDSSKVLFRYTNTTGFMGSSRPYELPLSRVDVQRRYRQYFDPNDFLLSLSFAAHWNTASVSGNDSVHLPKLQTGVRAMEAGWQCISKYHRVQPQPVDVDRLIAESLGELEGCPRHIVSLALQLANRDSTMTQTILLEGRLRSWWQASAPLDDDLSSLPDLPVLDRSVLEQLGESVTESEAVQKIQSLLDAVDVTEKPRVDHAASENIKRTDPVHHRTNIQYVSPIMRPNPGDVRFTLNSTRVSSLLRHRPAGLFMGQHPAVPLVPRRKNRNQPAPIDDPENDSALELLQALSHPGVALRDLLDAADYFGNIQEAPNEARGISSITATEAATDTAANPAPLALSREEVTSVASVVSNRQESDSGTAFANSESNGNGQKDSALPLQGIGAAAAAAAIAKRQGQTDSNSTPGGIGGAAAAMALAKRTASGPAGGGNIGVAAAAAAAAMEKRQTASSDGIGGAAAAAAAAAIAKRQAPGIGGAAAAAAAAMAKRQAPPAGGIGGAAAIAKRQAPGIGGAAAAAAAAAMAKRQGQTDSLPAENAGADAADSSKEQSTDVPLKEDPKYKKYFKMLKMGLPNGAVRNAMQRDDVDESILQLDPDRSYSSQVVAEKSDNDDSPALKDDPRYQKYFKMLKMGLPDGAVRNAMQRDDVDTSILDLDPEKSRESQMQLSESNTSADPPIKDDPKFQKYFKMLKMGLPDGAVRNAMQKDGVDESVLDLDPEKSFASQTKSTNGEDDDGIPIKDDSAFQKYFKMRKMGLPDGAIKNAMQRDGVDDSILDLDPEKSLKSQTAGSTPVDEGVPIKDDPSFQKYFKMMKMGLPAGAVRNAMERDGVDSSILDLDHNRSLQSQRNTDSQDDGVPLKDDPEWTKYFKMLKMGLPLGAVKNAVERDGKDASILDLDHSKSIASQTKASAKPQHQKKKKKRVRRKKIFWNPLDSKQIKDNSLWSNVRGRIQMSQLKYDPKEFADLFTESADPADKKKKKEKKTAKKAKKAVQVIDGKRSMNGGIILARLKLDYKSIAAMVDQMKIGNLDSTSVKALKDMLPTPDERGGLVNYMKKCGSSEEAQAKGYADFSECEKYMYTILDVQNAAAKFDCMLFRCEFKGRFEEILESIEIIERACDEIRNSEKLQAIMAIILTLVNEINTGGEGNTAAGFTLDALLKLREAKAFDKKTSVLNYLVKLVKSNDESLLTVRSDLKHVKEAELVILDSLCSDIQELKNEIEPIVETVTVQAEELEKAGKLTQMTLKELTEQRTSVRNLLSVPQYNQMDHHTGRTPMERFILNAESSISDALAFTDVVKGKFVGLLEYFGENSNTASNEFFGILNRFLAELDTAIQQVEREEKARKREEAKRAKKEKKKGKANGLTDAEAKKSQPGKKICSAPDVATDTATSGPTDGTKSPPRSGIAAMAAAAAAKKIAAAEKTAAGHSTPPPLSGIAAMAAAAAAKKSKQSIESPGDAPVSGIAALAAAAAKKKLDNVEDGASPFPTRRASEAAKAEANETENIVEIHNESTVSGIASLAAAVAVKKSKEANDGTDHVPVSGIAAMAAAAAKRKSEISNEDPESMQKLGIVPQVATTTSAMNSGSVSNAPLLSDIASVAALAATKRQNSSVHGEDAGTTPPTSIAAMAAAAAKRKSEARYVSDDEVTSNGDSTSVSKPEVLGLAAMAAAAAKKRTEAATSNGDANIVSKPEAPEISAMAGASTVLQSSKSHGDNKDNAETNTASIDEPGGESISKDAETLGDSPQRGKDLLQASGSEPIDTERTDAPKTETTYGLLAKVDSPTTKWLAVLDEAIGEAAFETQETVVADDDFDVRMNTVPKRNRQKEWLAAISDAIKKPSG